MTEKSNLLVEIGVEELPHSILSDSIKNFRNAFLHQMKEYRIEYGRVREFATPRRLALLIEKVNKFQDVYIEEKRGPGVEKAYTPDGTPTRALEGFLKGNSASLDEVVEKMTENGRYIFLEKKMGGRKTELLLPAILKESLKNISFPKTMRWEKTGFLFARPIRWILYLFDEKVVPFEIAGVKSGRSTRGHRAYSRGEIVIEESLQYEQKLSDSGVVADREKRKIMITQQMESIFKNKKLKLHRREEELLDTNVNLTELPHAVLCSFDPQYLTLPPEVLISEMVHHQHYFPLYDSEKEKLSGYFIAISNIGDNALTTMGYQRVLRARLDDGKFFFNEDRKRKLESYLQNLGSIIFHENLGTMKEKVERIRKISRILCELLRLDKDISDRTDLVALLCKCDLATLMVGEFPELQGTMGYYYALSSGYPEEVAKGIKEHYLPRFAQDELPSGFEGSVVGIADRIDTILGIFSLGIIPRGSKDPFGLRRKVLAIIRVVVNLKLNFSMSKLIQRAAELFPECQNRLPQVEEFFKNRIRSIFLEMGFSYDEIEASLANVLDDVYEAYRRVEALHSLREEKKFEDLLITFKRMSNIVQDQNDFHLHENLFLQKEEKELYNYFQSKKGTVQNLIHKKKYQEVYRELSALKSYVDNFFDNVLVMDENQNIRKNRIGLLKEILRIFSKIIDFSKIVIPGE